MERQKKFTGTVRENRMPIVRRNGPRWSRAVRPYGKCRIVGQMPKDRRRTCNVVRRQVIETWLLNNGLMKEGFKDFLEENLIDQFVELDGHNF